MNGKILEFLGYLVILLPIILAFCGAVDFKNELAKLGAFLSCLLGTALVFLAR